MAKSILLRIGLVLITIVAVGLGRGFFFYRGFYSPTPNEIPNYEKFTVPPAPTTEFTDNYTQSEGIILIDLAHENAFDKEELNVLLARLVSRGLTIKFLSAEDDLKKELLGKSEEEEKVTDEEKELAEKPLGKETVSEQEEATVEEEPAEELKPADVFIVISPALEFSKEEMKTIDEFMKNGKLLLIADPTRLSEINSISLTFGVLFESDYLYNMKENEINYRNIFLSEFKENGLTKGLKKIALYTAGSISSAESGIVFIDENTFSSVIESRKRLSPIALAQDAKVLAIHDLTFMTEPYNGILDNNQLISNVADWLMPTAKGSLTK